VRHLGAALLLVSCAAAPCRTKCGLLVERMPYQWTCKDVQDLESASMWAFKDVEDPRLQTCNARGFSLSTVDAKSWTVNDGRLVAGITYCNQKSMVVGNLNPRESTFTHELAHVLQNCRPNWPHDEIDWDHSNWERDGIYRAISKALDWKGEQ
jgi:hypothetical protein